MDKTPTEVDKSVEVFEKHLDNTRLIIHYSIERIDLLVISISTAALGFSIAFIKDVIPDLKSICLVLLKISWILFGFSIISNLLSQLTSYYANKFEFMITKNIIRKKTGKDYKGNQNNLECKKSILDNTTNILNLLSLVFLISGIVMIIIFINQHI